MVFDNLSTVPFQKDQLAIAVSHSNMGAGHIGLGFHSAKEGPKVLHLAWHKRLDVHAIPAELKTCWAAAPLGVPPAASKQLVAIVRAVANRGATICYGINFIAARGSFAANGSYKPPKNSDGLTCATFVVEVLRAGSVNLIKGETWRPDAANEAWGNAVCEELAKTSDTEHVAAVRKNVNGLRLRPFEVAGAARLGPGSWPADFDSVQEPATEIGGQLAQICPVVQPPAGAVSPT